MAGEPRAGIERLQADAREQNRAMDGLQRDLAGYRAGELAAGAEETASCRLVARVVAADANALKALATAIVAKPGFLVVLVSSSTPALVVIARSADVSVSSQKLITSLIAQFGGRGGGRPELAQA